MSRILVIEDEPDLQKILAYNLRKEGYEVLQALDGSEGLRVARAQKPDMVLLDLMLPDLPGTEVCKALKAEAATRDIPILMLTAKGEEIDRVLGFELGAEDYVVKPFSVRELLLRVQAILRRREPAAGGEGVLQAGLLQVDSAAHTVHVEGDEVRLTALEFRLLWTLMSRRGRVQTREVLLDEVWGITA